LADFVSLFLAGCIFKMVFVAFVFAAGFGGDLRAATTFTLAALAGFAFAPPCFAFCGCFAGLFAGFA
jgi:hypothetical protein